MHLQYKHAIPYLDILTLHVTFKMGDVNSRGQQSFLDDKQAYPWKSYNVQQTLYKFTKLNKTSELNVIYK
jgi:hypothetical protein